MTALAGTSIFCNTTNILLSWCPLDGATPSSAGTRIPRGRSSARTRCWRGAACGPQGAVCARRRRGRCRARDVPRFCGMCQRWMGGNGERRRDWEEGQERKEKERASRWWSGAFHRKARKLNTTGNTAVASSSVGGGVQLMHAP
jgi:hypothetical protein